MDSMWLEAQARELVLPNLKDHRLEMLEPHHWLEYEPEELLP
jgi:hypothetical protein